MYDRKEYSEKTYHTHRMIICVSIADKDVPKKVVTVWLNSLFAWCARIL